MKMKPTMFLSIAVISVFAFSANVFGSSNSSTDKFSCWREKYDDLRERAESGDAQALYDVFLFAYENASKLKEVLPDAISYLVRAAELGHSDAQYSLGFMAFTGKWLDKDENAALGWLLLAAQNGHIGAQLWCGEIFLDKAEMSTDSSEEQANLSNARYWLRRVIGSGDTANRDVLEAKHRLGVSLIADSIVDEKAWQLILDGADAGYGPSQETLSELREILREMEAEGYEQASMLLGKFFQSSNVE